MLDRPVCALFSIALKVLSFLCVVLSYVYSVLYVYGIFSGGGPSISLIPWDPVELLIDM